MLKSSTILVTAILSFSLVSCMTSPQTTSFLGNTLDLDKIEAKRFKEAWVSPQFDIKNYNKIYVSPVDFSHLKKLGWWDSKAGVNYQDDEILPGFKNDRNQQVAQDFANYFQRKLEEGFANNPSRLKLTQNKNAIDCLQMKVAITDLVPVKKYLAPLGYLGDGSLRGGTMAIEVKFVDAETGKSMILILRLNLNIHCSDVENECPLSFCNI